MPVVPPPFPRAPYDPLSLVLNSARVRLNDAIEQIGGEVLTNDQPFTQQMANNAWRRLQDLLANLGYSVLCPEVILTNLPVVANLDPASQVRLDWSSYFDGVSFYSQPVLPQDFTSPLKIWERWTGMNAQWGDPLTCFLDGLPGWAKGTRNGCWEWRENAIYLPGSLQVMDLRIRYVKYLADFVTASGVNWYDQPVPIMRSLDSFAWYIASEGANPRGDLDGATFDTKAEAAAKLIFNRDVRLKQRINIRRQGRSGRLHTQIF